MAKMKERRVDGRDVVKELIAGRRDAAAFAEGAEVHLAHPFETLTVEGYFHGPLAQLGEAFPDLERRNTILMESVDGHNQLWVGVCGYYCGTFSAPFLDIPPTRRMAAMRYHEFYRIKDGRIAEMQALWDIPELMMQAGAWPMGPSLGREWHVPGPATQDGLRVEGDGARALQIVGDMLLALGNNREGEAAMRLPEYWHENASWYGPSGIGTCRGIRGFRDHHQIPFLNAMPDRGGIEENRFFFAQGNYVGFTAWPGMRMTMTGDGWLGIAPSGQKLTMRSLDFWRVEGGKIAENWVLVDLLHAWHQLGVDVLARMRQLA
ncbi:MAG: ester cyclase [Pseudomonadota bacterium]